MSTSRTSPSALSSGMGTWALLRRNANRGCHHVQLADFWAHSSWMFGKGLCLYASMVSEGSWKSLRTFSSILSICRRGACFYEGLQVQFLDCLQICMLGALLRNFICRWHFLTWHWLCLMNWLLGISPCVTWSYEECMDWAWQKRAVLWCRARCWFHGNETLVRTATQKLMELKTVEPAVSLQVSDFLAGTGELEMSRHISKLSMARKVRREIVHGSIENSNHYQQWKHQMAVYAKGILNFTSEIEWSLLRSPHPPDSSGKKSLLYLQAASMHEKSSFLSHFLHALYCYFAFLLLLLHILYAHLTNSYFLLSLALMQCCKIVKPAFLFFEETVEVSGSCNVIHFLEKFSFGIWSSS